MSKKLTVKKAQGSSGGAAAAGGMNFQERVAALALVHFLIGSDDLFSISPGVDAQFLSLHMETAHAIDDVVLLGKEFRLLIQAKRKLDLSESATSDFSAAIGQFVRHHLEARRKGDRYVLATSPQSSDRIVFILRELTEAMRLNATALATDPLNATQKLVLERTRRLISHHLQVIRPGVVMAEEVNDLLRCIWILPLDLGAGGRDEASALALLRSRSLVEPRLIWNSILELTATLTQRRSSVDRAGLEERFGHFLKSSSEKKTFEDEFRFVVEQMNSFAAGKDVVVFDRFMGNENIAICEIYRFAADGSRRLSFAGNQCTLLDGSSHPILYRSSTVVGVNRFIDASAEVLAGRKVTLIPYSGHDDPDKGPWAQAHSAALKGYLHANHRLLHCLVCSDPISEDKALVVEVDEQDLKADLGCIHTRCYRSSLRVLGEIRSDLFKQFSCLTDFDYESWFLTNKHGPSLISGSLGEGIRHVLWAGKIADMLRGGWCTRIELEDGSVCYVTERGKVVRKSQSESIVTADEMTNSFDIAMAKKDPWCCTADRSAFGTYSALGSLLKQGQRLHRCIKAVAVPFSAAIDVAYSSKRSYYAPLLLLLDRETGRPIVIHGTVPMITSPFTLSAYIDNWEKAGMTLPNYSVYVLGSDRDFDDVVASCRERGLQVVIDPMVDLRGALLQGLVIQTSEDLVNMMDN
jgi:hypothetical protein